MFKKKKKDEVITKDEDEYIYSEKPDWKWINKIAEDEHYADKYGEDIEAELCKAVVELKKKLELR